ncbi:hypothetical protein [Coleofasciculus chthonoplastes]|uniref:hypothetical protein n=1 Tax=Coleofasciculus chthonoplastes TaxID=64178 RepID=UPI0032FCCCE7
MAAGFRFWYDLTNVSLYEQTSTSLDYRHWRRERSRRGVKTLALDFVSVSWLGSELHSA